MIVPNILEGNFNTYKTEQSITLWEPEGDGSKFHLLYVDILAPMRSMTYEKIVRFSGSLLYRSLGKHGEIAEAERDTTTTQICTILIGNKSDREEYPELCKPSIYNKLESEIPRQHDLWEFDRIATPEEIENAISFTRLVLSCK